jgi:hypothetical protein
MHFKKIFICSFFMLISLSLVSCSVIKPIKQDNDIKSMPVSKDTLDDIIKEHVESISVEPLNGGKPFCDYIIIDSEKAGNKINIYLWILAQEYFMQDSKLMKGTGGEFSAILILEQNDNDYKFLDCNISRAIDEEQSLNIFPKNIREKAKENSTFGESSLSKIERKAEVYFNK